MKDTEQPPQKTVVKVPCLVYSRIVGYLTPIDNWNDGKRQEFKDRKVFRPDVQEERLCDL